MRDYQGGVVEEQSLLTRNTVKSFSRFIVEKFSQNRIRHVVASCAVINNGHAATGARYYVKLYVDGAEKNTWYSDPPLNVNYYDYVQDYFIGHLSAGTHMIRILADATGTIPESNEADNEYTKTITVVTGGQPNLTPYKPAGWSDKIVVSNVSGTNSDHSPIMTTDNLYVD